MPAWGKMAATATEQVSFHLCLPPHHSLDPIEHASLCLLRTTLSRKKWKPLLFLHKIFVIGTSCPQKGRFWAHFAVLNTPAAFSKALSRPRRNRDLPKSCLFISRSQLQQNRLVTIQIRGPAAFEPGRSDLGKFVQIHLAVGEPIRAGRVHFGELCTERSCR